MTISIGGTNAASYASPITVPITMVNNFTTYPSASSLGSVQVRGTSASFTMQCSEPSTMFWAVGAYPSLAGLLSLAIQNNLTLSGNGLRSNSSDPANPYHLVYGVSYNSVSQPVSLTLSRLFANSYYQLVYYCVNQMGAISNAASSVFSTPPNGAYLMKLNLTFSSMLTFKQYNDLACALATALPAPAARVWVENAGYCGNYPFPQYSFSDLPNKTNSSGKFSYGFYLLPDYQASSDSLNSQALQVLSRSQFSSNLISLVPDAYNLPTLASLTSSSVLNSQAPLLKVSQVYTGATAVALYATMSNCNGFILGAVLKGPFLPGYALPSAYNLKAGVLTSGVSFLRVKSLYLAQGKNSTFTITGLQPNTSYSLVYCGQVDDPSLSATSGALIAVNFSTTPLNTITIYVPNLVSAILIILVLL
jgi:hypothetical protein